MSESNKENLETVVLDNDNLSETPNEPKIVQTNAGAKDGQNKCPKCGSTDISLNKAVGRLHCHFCRHEFEPQRFVKAQTDLSKLEGQIIGSGAQDIIADTKEVLTFKCQSCAAEVIIDTREAMQAKCHWCRNTLSVNEQIPNGAVPDMVLPFGITKEAAQEEINKFVKKRQFFAHPKFKQEFCTENIMGVYLPYMVIDINAHAKLVGQGERLVRQYTVKTGENSHTTYYDADLYDVEREFDIIVDSLTVEASSEKLQHKSGDKTNNVINAIMPFDTENCVKWDANYLRGCSSEKRDTNIEELTNLVSTQAKDISRHSANETLKDYNRGVCWNSEELDVKGKQWKAAYLPVWLYSYQSVNKDKKVLHYVAVNARNKKTMGSVPINKAKLLLFSIIVQIIGMFVALFVDIDIFYVLFLSGFVYYGVYYAKYRNLGARHKHEKDTKSKTDNFKKHDQLVKRRKGLTNARMIGANNTNVSNGGLLSGGGVFGDFVNNKVNLVKEATANENQETNADKMD